MSTTGTTERGTRAGRSSQPSATPTPPAAPAQRGPLAFIRRHPVLTYVWVTFSISWGSVLWTIGGLSHIPGTPEQTAVLFPAVYVGTVAGPSLAGLLLTVLIGGKAGLHELLSRLLRWRVGPRWYAVALMTAPVSLMATLLGLSLLSTEFRPGVVTTAERASLVQLGVIAGLATGFLEEVGWTGFAVPRLRLRYGVLATGLLMGVLWGAWHFVSNAWGSGASAGSLPPAVILPVLLFSFLLPYRVLMVWIYEQTGSLLLTMLMHASLVTFWLISTPSGIAGVPLLTWYLAWAAVLWALVAASVATDPGGRLGRRLRRAT